MNSSPGINKRTLNELQLIRINDEEAEQGSERSRFGEEQFLESAKEME